MRLRRTKNEYNAPCVEYLCESCGKTFTVCPPPKPEDDDQWRGCMARNCESFDPERDADRFFDDGDVISFDAAEAPALSGGS